MTDMQLIADMMDVDVDEMQTLIDGDSDFTLHTWTPGTNSGIFTYGGIIWDYVKVAAAPSQSCYEFNPQTDPIGQGWRDLQFAIRPLGIKLYPKDDTDLAGWQSFTTEKDALPAETEVDPGTPVDLP